MMSLADEIFLYQNILFSSRLAINKHIPVIIQRPYFSCIIVSAGIVVLVSLDTYLSLLRSPLLTSYGP